MSADRSFYRRAIAYRLRMCRFTANRSGKSVASEIGIHYSTLIKYEQGSSYLPAELIPILADIYGVPIKYFLPEGGGPTLKLPNFLKIKDRLNAKRDP